MYQQLNADWPSLCLSGVLLALSWRASEWHQSVWTAARMANARKHFLCTARIRRNALQRGRFAAERAYKPDARALAVLCSQRAEMLRLEQGLMGVWADVCAAECVEEGAFSVGFSGGGRSAGLIAEAELRQIQCRNIWGWLTAGLSGDAANSRILCAILQGSLQDLQDSLGTSGMRHFSQDS